MKRITDLPPSQQEELMAQLPRMTVYVEHKTGKEYVYFLGEQIEYFAAVQTQFLKG